MRVVFSAIQLAAPSSASVIITGESGTGKELRRRRVAIHKMSPRANGAFVPINCAALPGNSHRKLNYLDNEKGAFTGALERRAGHAASSTPTREQLFLDEIGGDADRDAGEAPPVFWSSSAVRRLGGQREIPVDVRVVAATNRPLLEAIEKKNAPLKIVYYRLNVFHIELPPLRHRKDDIPVLCAAFIRSINRKNDCHVTDIHPEVLRQFNEYSWPGNVRELRNMLERRHYRGPRGFGLCPAISRRTSGQFRCKKCSLSPQRSCGHVSCQRFHHGREAGRRLE